MNSFLNSSFVLPSKNFISNAIRAKCLYSSFSPRRRIRAFRAFSQREGSAILYSSYQRVEGQFLRANQEDWWMYYQHTIQRLRVIGGVRVGMYPCQALFRDFRAVRIVYQLRKRNLRNPMNQKRTPSFGGVAEILKTRAMGFSPPIMLVFVESRGSFRSSITLNGTQFMSLFQSTKPQFSRNLLLHFLPYESNTSCPLSISSMASITNPFYFWTNTQEDCLGILWFTMSAKGTRASVFTPLIVTPNILLQTAVLAQQNCWNGNSLNEGYYRQRLSQSLLRSSTFSWIMMRKGDPSNSSKSFLLKNIGNDGNYLGRRSMQGIHKLFSFLVSQSRYRARKVCLGERSSMFLANIFLEIGNSLPISKVIILLNGMQRILSLLLMVFFAIIPLQFSENSATVSLSNSAPSSQSHLRSSSHLGDLGVSLIYLSTFCFQSSNSWLFFSKIEIALFTTSKAKSF